MRSVRSISTGPTTSWHIRWTALDRSSVPIRGSWWAVPVSGRRCAWSPATPMHATCSTSPTAGRRSGTNSTCWPDTATRWADRSTTSREPSAPGWTPTNRRPLRTAVHRVVGARPRPRHRASRRSVDGGGDRPPEHGHRRPRQMTRHAPASTRPHMMKLS